MLLVVLAQPLVQLDMVARRDMSRLAAIVHPEAVFRSRDASALPAIDQALARETLPTVREALRLARAAIVLTDDATPMAARAG